MGKKRILIWIEENRESEAFGLLNAASRLYPEDENEMYGLCLQWRDTPVFNAFDYVVHARHENLFVHDAATVADCVEELQRRYGFDCILFPASPLGRMIAPRVAARLRVGLTADVTAITGGEAGVELIRPAFDGKIMAAIANAGPPPLVASIRPNVFKPLAANRHETAIMFTPKSIRKSAMRLLSVEKKKVSEDIRDSELLVSCGGGMAEHFHMIKPLAEKLGGRAAASRSIVDQGIAPRSIQVGQSGKTVSPKLYLAIGIYGSLQHIEGLKDVEHIICVNTNKDAPICSLADIVVEGDGAEFIRRLMERL